MRSTHLASLLMVLSTTHVALANEQQSTGKQEVTSTEWSLTTIACVALAMFTMVALAYLLKRLLLFRANKSKNDPGQLLHELCKAHGLSRRAERLLRKAAAAMGTPHPGRFFLEPQLLRQAATREELDGSKLALSLLYERLYGESVA